MKTGDTVRDGTGRSFQVGQLLGRGLWGKTYTAREEPGGSEWVLKVPLGPDAFPDRGDELARICREIGLEQGRFMGQNASPVFVRAEARFTTESGIPVLVMPRMPTSLRARMAPGAPLEALLLAIGRVAGSLRTMGPGLAVHGNLRPENILADGRGGWVLSDPGTPTLMRHLPALARARGVPLTWLPPEARSGHDRPLVDPSVDTHSLAAALLVGALTPHDGTPPPLPDDGLDKSTLVALKDTVRNRMKDEASNVRFHARLTDRLATLLNRALSRETSPSPPYRFNRADELQKRVEEVAALVRPKVSHVGRLLLDRPPGSDAFTTEEEVAFSCSVGCSPGVETHEDIGCGIAVFDLESDTRLRDVPCSYTVDRHPSGRYRFGFHLAGLEPGQYRIRIAFTIRDSGDEPVTAEGELTVHPAAGYVPPASEPSPQAIAFRARPAEVENTVTEVGKPAAAATPDAAPAAATAAASAPKPAPASPADVSEDDDADDAPVTPLLRGPRPIAPTSRDDGAGWTPPAAASGAASAAVSASASNGPRPSAEPPPAQPEYRGAGRWTELPLPDTGGGHGMTDPFADDMTEPLDPDAGPGLLERALSLTEGDAYKLFIGIAVVVIVVLGLALVALR